MTSIYAIGIAVIMYLIEVAVLLIGYLFKRILTMTVCVRWRAGRVF